MCACSPREPQSEAARHLRFINLSARPRLLRHRLLLDAAPWLATVRGRVAGTGLRVAPCALGQLCVQPQGLEQSRLICLSLPTSFAKTQEMRVLNVLIIKTALEVVVSPF